MVRCIFQRPDSRLFLLTYWYSGYKVLLECPVRWW